MPHITSTDTTTHPVLAIAKRDDGKTSKYPKTKPAAPTDASDAAWQTRYTTEHENALNTTQAAGQNSLALLTSLV